MARELSVTSTRIDVASYGQGTRCVWFGRAGARSHRLFPVRNDEARGAGNADLSVLLAARVHRDLKPENIMLVCRQGDPDFVKVLDFGLAKVATEVLIPESGPPGQALTKRGTIFGTPKYMAPEQCVSGAVDGRADLYALGLVLYEMLTGVHPFASKDILGIVMHQLSTPTPPIKSVAPAVSVPASLEAVVMRLTEKEPEKRYPNATALLDALAEVAEQEGISAPEPSARIHAPSARAVSSPNTTPLPSAPAEKTPPAPPSAPAAISPAPPPPKAKAKDASPTPVQGQAGKALTDPLRPLLNRLPAPLRRLPLPVLFLVPLSGVGALLFLLLHSGTPAAEDSATVDSPAQRSGAAPQPAADADRKEARRLTQSQAKSEVRAQAAAQIAISLQTAESCEAKRALLPQAARDGDRRTLEQLKVLTQTRNCGAMGLVDCWPCLRQGTELQQAIKAITARLRSNPNH